MTEASAPTGTILPPSPDTVAPAKPKPRVARRDEAGRFISTEAVAAALYSLLGESSVTLEADSKGQIKPKVTVVHRDPSEASRIAQRLFDELAVKYWQITPAKAA